MSRKPRKGHTNKRKFEKAYVVFARKLEEDRLVERTEKSLAGRQGIQPGEVFDTMGRPLPRRITITNVPLKTGDRILINNMEMELFDRFKGPPVATPVPLQVSAFNVSTGKWTRR